MGMAYAGAKGKTQDELLKGLGYSQSGLTRDEVLDAHVRHSRKFLPGASNTTINVFNGAAVDESLSVLPNYKEAIKNVFQAELYEVDFKQKGQEAVDIINEWVKNRTERKIEKLFSEPLHPDTRMLLLNAIYFKGVWSTGFNEQLTRKRPFFNSGLTPTEVDTMQGVFNTLHNFFDDLQVDVIDLPYSGHDYSMTILLPRKKDGVEALKRNLTVNLFEHLIAELREKEVYLTLPKFKFETEYFLKEPLNKLGIRHIFSDGADLSGISDHEALRVSKVVHKAVIEVNEKYSEAAAVTAVAVTRIVGGDLTAHVFVDHPFLFFIRNKDTRDILFAGQESYENTLTTSFKADLHKVEFLHGPQATLNLINDWVKEKTDGMIMRLFGGQLDRSTRLVLVNAIYFKGFWNRPFDRILTEKREFFNGGETRTEVDTMVGRFEVGYHVSDQQRVAVADLPYVGHDFSMTVLLPLENDGVERLRRNLTLDLFQSLVSELRGREVDVFLPKFKLDTKYILNEPLKSLGIRKIFGGGTDLSGINGDTDLVVDAVVQKAVVEVNEEGSEAASATGAGLMPLSAAVSPPPAFRVDHPFLFFIRNTRTRDILFAGQVNKL
ncbi:hypothetical protein HPB47_027199 [Ixodes persulcatus]|uniref:Uncharacterized protein n=1 Tax=Ixodes persulcatus TaxID=34615 RepID=A0AC60PWK5_IXOPE|nr:hypothetical protein HPB47_027199 [Ixodes persulcatus]